LLVLQLLVKAITTAILSAIGNLICQLVVEKQEHFDWKRFNTFTGLGFCYVAPALHLWYGVLNKLVTATGNKGGAGREESPVEGIGAIPKTNKQTSKVWQPRRELK
jgi:hypothetical protein